MESNEDEYTSEDCEKISIVVAEFLETLVKITQGRKDIEDTHVFSGMIYVLRKVTAEVGIPKDVLLGNIASGWSALEKSPK